MEIIIQLIFIVRKYGEYFRKKFLLQFSVENVLELKLFYSS